MSADLALVRSCADCHNHHPRAVRRNFQTLDVMGALVVRMNRDAQGSGLTLPSQPLPRPSGPSDRLKPPTFETPWVR